MNPVDTHTRMTQMPPAPLSASPPPSPWSRRWEAAGERDLGGEAGRGQLEAGRERLEEFRRERDSGERQNGELLGRQGCWQDWEDGKGFKGRGHGGRTFLMEGTVGVETRLGESRLPSSLGQNIRTRVPSAGRIHEGFSFTVTCACHL